MVRPRAVGVAIAACVAAWAAPRSAAAYGESVAGFPSWEERVLLEWTNRARSDPQVEMASCGAACGEGACYSPIAPLTFSDALTHASRFHAAEQTIQGYFAHDSQCTLVSNIASLYPSACQGQASCACVGGVATCNPTCTAVFDRIHLFGVSGTGEVIASGTSDPKSAFYLWLFENSPGTTCAFGTPNGHRWLLLKSNGTAGFGVNGVISVGDFAGGSTSVKIPSGSHYPRQGGQPTPVEVWANWSDTGSPQSARVNVDGACTPLTLARGTATNGAWHATLPQLSPACHRYFFTFTDSTGHEVTYPDTGSLGIGSASCADWTSDRPATCGVIPPVPATGAEGTALMFGLLLLAGVAGRQPLRAHRNG